MEQLVIHGGNPLRGRVKIGGAKNAVLPIIAAALLGSRGVTVLEDVPALEDVYTICAVLQSLGVRAEYEAAHHRLHIDATKIATVSAPYELVRKMRASFLIMGPLLAREGRAEISLPGGCAIGTRPIDLHLKGFEALGAEIEITQGAIHARAPHGLKGALIYFDFPSVGATENVMMAASCAEGQTILENPALEPEIVDLANFLNVMGAQIRGAGTNRIKIDGVPSLCAADYTIIPDRIEAGTYMVAAAMTRGDVFIENAISEHLKPVVAKLKEAGATIEEDIEGIRVRADGPMQAIALTTLPYPGFPTDMQAQFMAMLAVAEGTSVVTETVFENRFMHVSELARMGADIRLNGHLASVYAPANLNAADVMATDLRASSALILAARIANGESLGHRIYHLDRGDERLEEKFKSLGAKIVRLEE